MTMRNRNHDEEPESRRETGITTKSRNDDEEPE